MDGYALHNWKLREQRGLQFQANLSVQQNHLKDLLKGKVLGPTPEFLSQAFRGGA